MIYIFIVYIFIMENLDRDHIEKIVQTRKLANAYYQKKSKVYRSFLEMEQNTYKDGALTKGQKELIAIGISIVMNCESCMEWHISQAIADGNSEEQIIEAIEVGIEMSGGPGTVSARFAMNVLEYYTRF
jgi:AhpD family alkylhydroperoxidase